MKVRRWYISVTMVIIVLAIVLTLGVDIVSNHTQLAYAMANGQVYPAPITEFPIPTTHSWPDGITTGPDHNLWFTEYNTSKIGRSTPGGSVTDFSIPSGGTPTGITTGPDGNVWFTERSGHNIGRITPDGVITEFPYDYSSIDPGSITTGPDGNLWFADEDGAIGRITPKGTIVEFPIPNSSINPAEITTGPDGKLWFTSISQIGNITPTGIITDFSLHSGYGFPQGITTGSDGNIWFTEQNTSGNAIGRITPKGVITDFPIPYITYPDRTTWPVTPAEITSGPDGNLWFTSDAQALGRITPTGDITEFISQNASSFGGGIDTTGITTGPDGNIWFGDNAFNKVGYLALGGTTPTPVPTTPTPTPSRHKLFFFLQGFTSALDKSGAIPYDTFGHPNGIYQTLSQNFPSADYRMFSYASSTSPMYPAYSCPDTFSQTIPTYVEYLRNQLYGYLTTHPNTDVYLIGHSFGGAIAFAFMEDVVRKGGIINGGRIAGVTTLDSPVGGIPAGIGGAYETLLEHAFKSISGCETTSKFTALDSLTATFNRNTNISVTPYGSGDLILPQKGDIPHSNQYFAEKVAHDTKTAVLTLGNTRDYIYDLNVCPHSYGIGPSELLSTQWIQDKGSGSLVYARDIAAGTKSCPTLSQSEINHSVVFSNSGAVTAIVQFVKGQTPTLSIPVLGI